MAKASEAERMQVVSGKGEVEVFRGAWRLQVQKETGAHVMAGDESARGRIFGWGWGGVWPDKTAPVVSVAHRSNPIFALRCLIRGR